MSATGAATPLDEAPAAATSSGTPDAPEREVAFDMVRRSIVFAVPLLAAGALGWQWSGVWSVGLALGLVLVNFVLGAAMIGWGARLGPGGLMAAALGGYVLRLGIVAAAVLPVLRFDWFEVLPFAVSLLVTHLGLLVVESRHVAASAAYPGLKPGRGFLSGRDSCRPSSSPLEPSA